MKSRLASANQNLHQAEEMRNAPDMEEAINILKRSSLEVELAAKEKEVSGSQHKWVTGSSAKFSRIFSVFSVRGHSIVA